MLIADVVVQNVSQRKRRHNQGVLFANLESKRILGADQSVCEILGYTVKELVALSLFDIVVHSPRQIERAARITLDDGSVYLSQRIFRRKDGALVSFEVSVSRLDLADGSAAVIALHRSLEIPDGNCWAISARTFYDVRTGLATRRTLSRYVEKAIRTQTESGDELIYMLVDIDRFSSINERYGISVGDRVIDEVARRLSSAFSPCDIIARLEGGDEFAVVHSTSDGEACFRLLTARVAAEFETPIAIDASTKLSVSPSIGGAVYPKHVGSFDGLSRAAGTALKHARRYRTQSALYSNEMSVGDEFGIDIISELLAAIERDSLSLVFQRIVETSDLNLTVGAEALVRWFHPSVGRIPPSYFVVEAEDADVVHKLDMWVIDKALQHLSRAEPITTHWISINVSTRTLLQAGIGNWIKGKLQQYKIPAHRLMLEVTETAAMMNRECIVDVLVQLRSLGVKTAMDDFGTGYSSLAYLKHLPFDVVKIDREFVNGIGSDARDEHTVRTLVSLLRSIDCQLLAEGVETEAQWLWLKSVGIEMIQGYWIGRPGPIGELIHRKVDTA